MCVGPYGVPRGVAVSYERGTHVPDEPWKISSPTPVHDRDTAQGVRQAPAQNPNLKLPTLNPKPQPQTETLNPKPETLNTKP